MCLPRKEDMENLKIAGNFQVENRSGRDTSVGIGKRNQRET